jgi:hypothetical protein
MLEETRQTVIPLASLLAAMTIAGAFWVGVLAARRLRDWGEGRRALEGRGTPLALAAGAGSSAAAVAGDEVARRIRARVAERVAAEPRFQGVGRSAGTGSETDSVDGALESVRVGDVLVVRETDTHHDGDYLVEGILSLRDGLRTLTLLVGRDGARERWLVDVEEEVWWLVEPIDGHGLVGEPPRQIRLEGHLYGLERRGQASTAGDGQPGRPNDARVAFYLYVAGPSDVLWVERWGERVLVGRGRPLGASHQVELLPGS